MNDQIHFLQFEPEVEETTSARWGQKRRLEFIDFRLRWEGRLNRSDLTEFFKISVPRASLDISFYQSLAPNNMAYDRRAKVYLKSSAYKPLFASNVAARYLNELLGRSTGITDPVVSFIGWMPPADSIGVPLRTTDDDKVATILQSIRDRRGLRILYQSISRSEPSSRVIVPTAFANDGLRWHIRAFCQSRQEFRDFVIARIIEIQETVPAGDLPMPDTQWHTTVRLVIGPHPDLCLAKRRAIELDYGMKNGEVEFKCRQALLLYTLRRLHLDLSSLERPEIQQIILVNRKEVEPYLPFALTSS